MGAQGCALPSSKKTTKTHSFPTASDGRASSLATRKREGVWVCINGTPRSLPTRCTGSPSVLVPRKKEALALRLVPKTPREGGVGVPAYGKSSCLPPPPREHSSDPLLVARPPSDLILLRQGKPVNPRDIGLAVGRTVPPCGRLLGEKQTDRKRVQRWGMGGEGSDVEFDLAA